MQIHLRTSFLTQSFLLSLSDSITAKKQEKHIKESISVSEITIYSNSTNIINGRML